MTHSHLLKPVEMEERSARVDLFSHIDKSQAKILSLFDDSPIAVATIVKENLTFTSANQFYCDLVGRKKEDIVGHPLLVALPEISGQGFDQLLKDVLRTGVAYVSEEVPVQIKRRGKLESIYVNLSYQPIKDANGENIAILVIATEVTNTVKALEQKKVDEAKFRSLITEAPMAICLFTGYGVHTIEIANRVMLDVWGKDETAIGKPLIEALPELVGQPFIDILNEIYITKQPFVGRAVPAQLERKGVLETYYFDFTYQPLFDADGNVYGIIDMALDVTDQTLSRQKVEKAEATLRSAVDLAELATWEVDLIQKEARYSERLQEWIGSSSRKLTSASSPFVHPDDNQRIAVALNAAIEASENGIFDETYKIVNSITGQVRIIHSTGVTHYDDDKKPVAIIGTSQDVTLQTEQQLALEEQVKLSTEKLINTNINLSKSNKELLKSNEALSQFAYVASHDLQEPLRKVKLFSEMLRSKTELTANGHELVDRISKAADRMSNLVRDLLNFSRLSKPHQHFEVIQLDVILKEVISDFDLLFEEKNVALKVGTLPAIQAIPLQMTQLFYNLISNSLKFCKPGQNPKIEIACEVVPENEIAHLLNTQVDHGRYFRIVFEDNGIGFENEYAEQIFEIFKRLHAKDDFAGTGIGLALCKTIVQNHQGTIFAESELGVGSKFHIILPESQQLS